MVKVRRTGEKQLATVSINMLNYTYKLQRAVERERERGGAAKLMAQLATANQLQKKMEKEPREVWEGSWKGRRRERGGN